MTIAVEREPLVLGVRVTVTAGDLAGERGVVVEWEYRSLAYNHRPDDPRLYWVEVDGDPARVPFLREQLSVDSDG